MGKLHGGNRRGGLEVEAMTPDEALDRLHRRAAFYITIYGEKSEESKHSIALAAAVKKLIAENEKANALRLASVELSDSLDALLHGTKSQTFLGYENGHGEEVGSRIQAARNKVKRLTKNS
jgi:hypothetical protein